MLVYQRVSWFIMWSFSYWEWWFSIAVLNNERVMGKQQRACKLLPHREEANKSGDRNEEWRCGNGSVLRRFMLRNHHVPVGTKWQCSRFQSATVQVLLTHGGDALISWSWEWYERFSVHPPRVLFQDTEPYVFGRLLSHQPTQKNPMTLMENKTASNVAGFFFCKWRCMQLGKYSTL